MIVGASGDVAKKKTYPALYELWQQQKLPLQTIIYGFARTKYSHQQLRDHVRYVF
jgi:glucose-6-phosphate 1-dehydrogenase